MREFLHVDLAGEPTVEEREVLDEVVESVGAAGATASAPSTLVRAAGMSEEPVWDGPLPDAVRTRVVTFAADTLGALAEDEVPGSLKRFRSWAPQHRRTRAGTPLAAAVDRDVTFRQRVAGAAREELPDLAAALDAGEPPPAADPVDVAAVAYLARTPGWAALVAAAAAEAERASAQAGSEAQASEVGPARGRAGSGAGPAPRPAGRAEGRAGRGDRRGRVGDQGAARGEGRPAAGRAGGGRGGGVGARLAEGLGRGGGGGRRGGAPGPGQGRRGRGRAEASRRATREGRSLEDSRVRLLLDTVVESAGALRRELALPPVSTRPGRPRRGRGAGGPGRPVSVQALLSDDPALLDQLLSLPQVHLIVDGYNVTKTGYPDLSLEKQRTRLLMGLSNLAARCGAEVTCCFVLTITPQSETIAISATAMVWCRLLMIAATADLPSR